MGNAEGQTMWGNCVFKWRVLGLHLSDLDKILDKHTLGDEERSYEAVRRGQVDVLELKISAHAQG